MLLIGLVLLAVGYSGGLGSPVAHQVQAFLDADGTPLRNVHKLEPLLRLPLVLGLAHLLGRMPLPGSAPRREWIDAFAHPEHDKRVAVGVVVLVALAAATSLAWTGRLTPPGAFTAIPQYWHDAADWLDEHNTGAATPGRVLVVPGAPFATQVWGNSHDEPLQVLGNSPWGVRDSIPLTPPQTIRALDSVQRLFAAGRPSAGLADTLARQGISYVVVRNDLDPETSRSARPLLVHRAIDGSPGLTKVAQFGDPVGPGTLEGFITDSGLRPRYPAVEIYRVDDAGRPPVGAVSDRHRRDGPRRRRARSRCCASTSAGDCWASRRWARAADRRRPARRVAGPRWSPSPTPRWRAKPTTAASTTTRRRSAPRTTPGTPSTACSTTPPAAPTWCTAVDRRPAHARRVRRRTRRRCPTSRPRPARPAAIDGDSVDQLGVQLRCRRPSANGCRSTSTIRSPTRTLTITPSATAVGAQVRRHRGVDRQRHQHAAVRRGRASR